MEIQGGKSFLNFGIHGGGGGYEKHTFTNMIEREGNIYSQWIKNAYVCTYRHNSYKRF